MKIRSIQYFKNNHLIEECNPSFGMLSFLYNHACGHILRALLRQRCIARIVGLYNASKRSKRNIIPFIKRHSIAMDDFIEPAGGYTSFNDFFIRKLQPGARTVASDSHAAVAPSDCKVHIISPVATNTHFFAKHQPFTLAEFLNSQHLAEQFAGGTLFMFRLAPYDYHRFHFPADCTPSAPQHIKGALESVNPIAFLQGIQPLITNERHLITLETQQFGTILMIPVGAMMVGAIHYTYTPGKKYAKGDEAGYFEFGGSTVVLLFKEGTITPKSDFIKNSLQGFETAVTMGEMINE